MKREENKYNDCISRQAVLELLQNEYIEISITDAGRKEVTIAEINVDKLKALPSVEPEQNLQPTCNQLATDCISRQAVLDRINKLIEVEKKQGTDDWGYGRERVNAYEAMLHMVESEYLYTSVEPVRMDENWIPVTDRLPDAGDTYIVNIEYKGKFEGVDVAEFVFSDDGYIDGKWNTWNDWKEGPDTFYHVSAWMPLPDPYKDEMEV